MAYENSLKTDTAAASASFASSQYLFATLTSTGLAVNTVSGGRCIGIIQDNQSTVGSASEYGYLGVSKVMAGGTFVVGDFIQSDGAGKAIKATTGNTVLGVAKSAGAASSLATMLILPVGANAP